MDLAIDLIMSWLCIANLSPPDLWDYVHGFGYQPQGLIVLFVQPIEDMANLTPPDLLRYRAWNWP